MEKEREEEDDEEEEDEEIKETEKENDRKKRARFRQMGSLGKLHNIIVHIRKGHKKEFKKLAGRMIPLDNCTRWNSWYNMFIVADTTAAAIDIYTKNHFETLQQEYLSPEDWIELRKVPDFLQPFYRAIMATQGDNITLNRVLVTMDTLIHIFKEASVSNFPK